MNGYIYEVLTPFLTDEERRALENHTKEQNDLTAQMSGELDRLKAIEDHLSKNKPPEKDATAEDVIAEAQRLDEAEKQIAAVRSNLADIQKQVDDIEGAYKKFSEALNSILLVRYAKDAKAHNIDTQAILNDLKHALNEIRLEDYREYVKQAKPKYKALKEECKKIVDGGGELTPDQQRRLDIVGKNATARWSNCVLYLKACTWGFYEALIYSTAGDMLTYKDGVSYLGDKPLEKDSDAAKLVIKGIEQADELVKARADAFGYKRPVGNAAKVPAMLSPDYGAMVHGGLTDNFGKVVTTPKKQRETNINGLVTIKSGEYTLTLPDPRTPVGVGTDKLFLTILQRFTEINQTSDKVRIVRELDVWFPFEEYIRQRGYDPDDEQSFKYALQEINAELNALYEGNWNWTEKTRNKFSNYSDFRILQDKGINADGMIHAMLSEKCANYLIKLPLTKNCVALQRVDNKNPNAYLIGKKLALNYFNDNNRLKGNYCRLKVSTILKVTNLPTIETVKSTRKSWTERIKEPFENGLESLVGYGVLTDWRYCKTRGEDLPDEDADFINYDLWANTLVEYEMKDAPDDVKRLNVKREKIAEKKEAEKTARKEEKKRERRKAKRDAEKQKQAAAAPDQTAPEPDRPKTIYDELAQ